MYSMPRSSRLDALGALNHIMIRGIERRKIFKDDDDREEFLERLEKLLPITKTSCFAWALIPNHAHFLFRTGNAPIATLMSVSLLVMLSISITGINAAGRIGERTSKYQSIHSIRYELSSTSAFPLRTA